MAEDEHGEKTETPTPAMLETARRRGQIAYSRDFATAIIVAVTVFTVAFLADQLVRVVAETFPRIATEIAAAGSGVASGPGSEATESGNAAYDPIAAIARVSRGIWRDIARALAPLLALAAVAAIAGSVLQTGFNIASERPTFDLDKINVGRNLKQKMLSTSTFVELGRAVVKIAIIAALIYFGVWRRHQDLVLGTLQADSDAMLEIFGRMLTNLALPVAALLLGLGMLDLLYQRWRFGEQMKVSRQTLREEYKREEGDQQVKGMRKALHMHYATQDMLRGTRERAAVVLRNPTHLAVAIEYDQAAGGAPVVVAKGMDLFAEEILAAAKEGKVPVKRDIKLARALYPVEVGSQIPPEFYRAVWAVLKWAAQERRAREASPQRLGALMARLKPRRGSTEADRRDP